MTYKEITVNTTTQASELVADILSDLGSKGIGIYDSNDFFELIKSEVIWDYVNENLLTKSQIVQVKGYYEKEIIESVLEELDQRLSFLKQNCPFEYGSLEIVSADVDDEDWVNTWKKYYKPINAGKITIVPNWLEYDAKDGEVVVKMDPGMAFGTGQHESTKMCLDLMQDIGMEGKRVIDVGTGSGILGISACKLGAKQVFAYDIDDLAVRASHANAVINNVQDIFDVANSNLLDKSSGSYDVVLANITADVLIVLSEKLKAYVNKGGIVVISGIILKREQEVIEAFLAQGYKVVQRINQGEWVAFKLSV